STSAIAPPSRDAAGASAWRPALSSTRAHASPPLKRCSNRNAGRVGRVRQLLDTIGSCVSRRKARHTIVSTAVQAVRDVRRDAARQSNARVAADGKFLRLGNERFLVKGVTYGTFAPDGEGY